MGSATVTIGLKAIVIGVILFIAGLMTGYFLPSILSQNANSMVAQERIDLFSANLWIENDMAEAAIIVINRGSSSVTIDRISVAGVNCPWGNVYFWKCEIGEAPTQLKQTEAELTGSSFIIPLSGSNRTFTQAQSSIKLDAEKEICIYIAHPSNISLQNLPQTATITVFTANGAYYTDAEVSATMNFTQTEQVTFTGYSWGTPGTATVPTFTFTVKNTGSADLTISEVRVDGMAVSYCNGSFPIGITKGTSAQFVLTPPSGFTRGTSYEFSVTTTKGNVFGPYVKTAP